MNSVGERHEQKGDKTTLIIVQPNENIYFPNKYNAVNEYTYMELHDNIQSPVLKEALEMRTIEPQEAASEYVSVQPEQSDAIMTSHETAEPGRRQEGKKFQFSMIYFNAALLICLIVAFSVVVCEILL